MMDVLIFTDHGEEIMAQLRLDPVVVEDLWQELERLVKDEVVEEREQDA